MLRLALEPFEDETWGGAFGSTAEDCERLRSLLLVEVAKGLSEGPADGAGSPAGDDDEALCAYCGGEGRGGPGPAPPRGRRASRGASTWEGGALAAAAGGALTSGDRGGRTCGGWSRRGSA